MGKGIEGGSFNRDIDQSSSVRMSQDKGSASSLSEIGTGASRIPTAEGAARRIARAEAATKGIEAITALTKIAEVKKQAEEILKAIYATSKAVDTSVETAARIVETMLIKNASGTIQEAEDVEIINLSELEATTPSRPIAELETNTSKRFSLFNKKSKGKEPEKSEDAGKSGIGKRFKRTFFSSRYKASNQEPIEPSLPELEAISPRSTFELEGTSRAELESIPSRLISELEGSSIAELQANVARTRNLFIESESRSKGKEPEKSEDTEITREEIAKKAEGVARIGVDVASKAREAEEIAEGATKAAEEADVNAKKIYKSSRVHTQSITTDGEEVLSMEEVRDTLAKAADAVSKAENVTIETVFLAIDAVVETAALMPFQEEREEVLSMKEVKEVITKVALELFPKAEAKANLAIHAAVEEKAAAEKGSEGKGSEGAKLAEIAEKESEGTTEEGAEAKAEEKQKTTADIDKKVVEEGGKNESEGEGSEGAKLAEIAGKASSGTTEEIAEARAKAKAEIAEARAKAGKSEGAKEDAAVSEMIALSHQLEYIFIKKIISELKAEKMSVADAKKNSNDFLAIEPFTTPEETYSIIMDFASTHEPFSELKDYMNADHNERNEKAKVTKMQEYLNKIMALEF